MPMHLGVDLNAEVRPGVASSDLGIALDPPLAPAPEDDSYAHRLVTLGDSLTHGFQHFAIFNSRWSWPSMVATRLGLDSTGFRRPAYTGPGGHPLNLEWIANRLDGGLIREFAAIDGYMEEVEVFYEFNPGEQYPQPGDPINNNLAIWGWDLRDTLSRTADTEAAQIGAAQRKLIPMVNYSGQRGAVKVLNSARKPSGKALTPLEAARQLGDDPGGIETLCVWLGANNILPAVVSLKITLSGPDYRDLDKKSAYTVWTNEHFDSELELVAGEVEQVTARHVLWATIPHVTIPPVTHGLGRPLDQCGRYFQYYARPWETDQTFNPMTDRHLTGMDAWALDTIIDGYNTKLESLVADARRRGLDWQIVDTCALLDQLAYRRNVDLAAPAPGWAPYELPAVYGPLDTRFFTTDNRGTITSGGLIGLDGVHPTTAAYGLVAQKFVDVMSSAGVNFPGGAQIPFDEVIHADTLVSTPPPRVADVFSLLNKLDRDVHLFERLIPLKHV